MQSSILIIDDQDSIRHFLEKALRDAGHDVRSAGDGGRGIALFEEQTPDLALVDLRLPDTTGLDLLMRFKERAQEVPVLLMTAFADVETAVEAMKKGAFDYLTKPINLEQLQVVCEKALDSMQMRRELAHHRRMDRERYAQHFVRGTSARMEQVYEVAEKVALSDSTSALITGESGTGKQIIAGLIHSRSPRSNRPFLEVNCAAIPRELLESELFGHERGAFTDARTQKQGLLELANGGSLFLDEVGEMGLNLQVKMLKVLESMTFRRVGGTRDIRVSVRVISATNQNLEELVRSGNFRDDLYYRLMVVPIHVPALRERREDISLLGRHYLEHFAQLFNKRFRRISPEAERKLVEYPWPGNIRELRNVFERAVLLEDGETLEASHLRLGRPAEARPAETVLEMLHRILVDGVVDQAGIPFEDLMERVERGLILRAAEATGWNQSRAAELLNIKRDKLRYRMKHHELSEAFTVAVDTPGRPVGGAVQDSSRARP